MTTLVIPILWTLNHQNGYFQVMLRTFITILLLSLGGPASAQVMDKPLADYVAAQEAIMDDHFKQGRYAEAEAVLRPLIQKLSVEIGPTQIKVLRLRQALANTMRLQGRTGDALAEMEEAYEVWQENYLKFHPARMDAAMQLAVHLSRMGFANDALPLALEASKFAETVWGDENEKTLLWQYNTAGIFKQLGHTDEALTLFDAVLPRLDAVGTSSTAYYACAVSKERARLLRDIDQLEQAAAAYSDTVTRMRSCHPANHPETIYTLGEYALVLYYLRDIPRMKQVLNDWQTALLPTFGKKSLQYAEFLARRALARSWETLGTPEFDAAMADMRASVALREELLSPTHEFTGKAYLDLGAMEMDLGNLSGAWDLAKKAEAAGLGSRALLQETLVQMRDAGLIPEQDATREAFRLAQVNYNSAARAAFAALAQRVEQGDGQKAQMMRAFTDLQRRQGQLQSDMSYFAGLPSADRQPAVERQIRTEMTALSEQINDLGAQLRTMELPFEDMYDADPLSLDAAQALLGPDEALVIFDVGERQSDWSFVLVVTADTATWREMPLSLSGTNAAISDLRGSIDLQMGVRAGISLKQRQQPKDRAYELSAAHWIYQQTFGVIEDLLQGKDHLYVELRGPLTALPPQLLVRNDVTQMAQADWLVRHHAMTVIPSIQALQLSARNTQRAPKPFLGFADPVFSGDPMPAFGLRGALAPLPETAIEVQEVAQAVGTDAAQTVRAQSMASEAQLKQEALADYRVLYFATHGLVAGDMVRPGQELTEPALALTAGQGEDGMLTASEIAGLKLNADWVVLSACNTAVGDEPGAEALSGLAQAFAYAGARALMVSHWPVESRSAVALMTDLFERRAKDPSLSAAKAQQQAILAMIDTPARAEWSHPAYWAPFILVGDPD
ncbi:MAG: CHAT domain-containing protein [Thalassovita sp.]